MKILIKIPTRNRPVKFFNLLDTCIEKLSGDNDYRILVSLDYDDLSMCNIKVFDRLCSYENLYFFYSNRDTKIGACNRDIEKMPDDWQVVALISDDMLPVVDNWDKYISNDMNKHFPDTDGALWYFDGRREDINTVSILGNKYYKRFGYIYYPLYRSFCCDDEHTKVAEKLQKLHKCHWPMILIKHNHYSFTEKFRMLPKHVKKSNPLSGADKTYVDNRHGFKHDMELLNERSKMNYGL